MSDQSNAIELELFSNRFSAIAWEMGELMRRVAISTNVKERLDFSCGLLDPEGRLVVNAPHIPVHLGALGLCVRSVAELMELAPGDVVVTNHPGFGGSHLPDITVITPVFDPGDLRVGYVATRAHHAELGGSRPGSMPPAARSLGEEGVVIPPMLLVRAGVPQFEAMRDLLLGAPFPTRSVEENLADLQAAIAANNRGRMALRNLVEQHGRTTVREHMALLAREAGRGLDRIMADLPSTCSALERLDDGSPLQVEISIAGGEMTFDFSGSAPVHPGNLYATPAVIRSAVLYVLRVLGGGDLPLNEGLLERVHIEVPTGLLNPDFPQDPALAPAVVGGHVDTSQRLVDLMFRAVGAVACSQGTMNNVLFGNQHFGYYETVCGGSGAGPGFDGASATHTHMTNTAITDPEVLELRYPVRLERFAIRTGSGGGGKWRGGDGVIRELTFLKPLALSVLGQHRTESPYGVEGGEPGATARVRVVHADGTVTPLGSVDQLDVEAGDRLILETPGGGGWGAP
jgi:5-oxoprolinase (ATP-hydrolysing)